MEVKKLAIDDIPEETRKTVRGSIDAIRVYKDGEIYVKVRYADPVQGSQLVDSRQAHYVDPNDEKSAIKLQTISNYKLIRPPGATKSSPAIYMDGKQVHITNNEGNTGVAITDSTVQLSGSIHLAAHPEDIRIGGMWRLNGNLTSTIPSTIVTPVPFMHLDIPVDELPAQWVQILSDISSMLSPV